MSRKNRTGHGTAVVSPVVTTANNVIESEIKTIEKVEDTMKKAPLVDITAVLGNDDESKAIIAQKTLEASDKDWRKDELEKLDAEMKYNLDIIDNACKACKEGITDNLVLESINLKFKLKKVAVKSLYEAKMKPLRVTGEQIGAVAEVVTYEKSKALGVKLSAPFKIIKGIANGVADGTGIKNFWNK